MQMSVLCSKKMREFTRDSRVQFGNLEDAIWKAERQVFASTIKVFRAAAAKIVGKSGRQRVEAQIDGTVAAGGEAARALAERGRRRKRVIGEQRRRHVDWK